MNSRGGHSMNPYASPYSQVSTNDDDNGDDFIMRQVKQQKAMMNQQDRDLDVLGDAVGRIGLIAQELGGEITAQNKMIDELDEDMDQAQGNIDLVTAKTKDLIKKSGGCQWFALIVCLVVILVALAFLVIYS